MWDCLKVNEGNTVTMFHNEAEQKAQLLLKIWHLRCFDTT